MGCYVLLTAMDRPINLLEFGKLRQFSIYILSSQLKNRSLIIFSVVTKSFDLIVMK